MATAAGIRVSAPLTMDNMPTEEQTYRQGIIDRLDGLKDSIGALDKKVSYTNGKVRKIIIAIFLISGILFGELFSPKEIVSLIATHFLP